MFIRCNILYCVLFAVHAGVLNLKIKAERDARRRRLTGGYEEENGARPYAALLRLGGDAHAQCSAAIVSPTAELTAAHCYSDCFNVSEAFVYAGNVWFRNKEDFEPPTQTRHLSLCNRYNALAVTEFDVMICRHEEPWHFDEYFVAPVQIFTATERLQPSFKLRCQVAGFGRKGSGLALGYLHAYPQVMETWRACREASSEQFMCTLDTHNKTMCSGDAGGPVACLVKRRLQLFGLLAASSAPESECCEVPVAWNVVTFLGYYRNWLKTNIPDLPSEADFIDVTTHNESRGTTTAAGDSEPHFEIPEHTSKNELSGNKHNMTSSHEYQKAQQQLQMSDS